jgi:hypothetical protein
MNKKGILFISLCLSEKFASFGGNISHILPNLSNPHFRGATDAP